MMHRVLISLASNHEQEDNLCKARCQLAQVLSGAVYTEEIWTVPEGSIHRGPESTGATQPTYLNQLVSAETMLGADELVNVLKGVETALGRTAERRSMGIVPVDLDLLLHDNRRYHHRDWQRSYVRRLLPDVEHAAKTPT